MKKKMTKENEAFWALSQKDQRIAIAKDVLKWLEKGKLIAEEGIYIDTPSLKRKEDAPLDELFHKEPCTVCALGACFIGLVDLGNNVMLSDIGTKNSFMWTGTSDDLFRPYLRKIFSRDQLSLIESAFEYSRFPDGDVYSMYANEAVEFGNLYNEDDKRLIAIMQNIIDNDGTFRP